MIDKNFDEFTSYAKWYEILLAKMFGTKLVGMDGDTKVVSYFYKGKQFVKEIK